jgi:hypothetical protein
MAGVSHGVWEVHQPLAFQLPRLFSAGNASFLYDSMMKRLDNDSCVLHNCQLILLVWSPSPPALSLVLVLLPETVVRSNEPFRTTDSVADTTGTTNHTGVRRRRCVFVLHIIVNRSFFFMVAVAVTIARIIIIISIAIAIIVVRSIQPFWILDLEQMCRRYGYKNQPESVPHEQDDVF